MNLTIPKEIVQALSDLNFDASIQQIDALLELWEFCTTGRRYKEKYFGLYGFAGSGKSSVIQVLVKALRLNTAQCAPTNKAVKVLAQKGRAAGNSGSRYDTVHELLGLVREIDENGNVNFIQKESVGNKRYLDSYDLVIVDECSMIGQELWAQIQAAAVNKLDDHNFTQVILMGDPAQLPPISRGGSASEVDPLFVGTAEQPPEIVRESPIFSAVPRSITLSEVMRYDGQLTLLAKALRDDLDAAQLPALNDYLGTDQITCDDAQGWTEGLIALFQQGEPADYCKAICYTNKAVDHINAKVRLAVLGAAAADTPYLPGDRLVLKSALQQMGSVVLSARSEVQVTKATLQLPTENDSTDPAECFKHWRIIGLDEDQIPRSFQILAEDECERFAKRCRRLQAAAKAVKNSSDRKRAWTQYYEFAERFIEVQYAFAMTCHSAQGSTYKHTYVNLGDLLKNRNLRERNQLLYTAITRASKTLVLAI